MCPNREGARLNVLDNHAFAGGNFQLVGDLGCNGAHRDAELALFRSGVFFIVVVFAETRRE